MVLNVGRICPICGPKLSICCFVMSAWAIVFLGILGIFFYIQSATLIEDTLLPDDFINGEIDEKVVEERYRSLAYNCWIATGWLCGYFDYRFVAE